jgi:hypothetical protein
MLGELLYMMYRHVTETVIVTENAIENAIETMIICALRLASIVVAPGLLDGIGVAMFLPLVVVIVLCMGNIAETLLDVIVVILETAVHAVEMIIASAVLLVDAAGVRHLHVRIPHCHPQDRNMLIGIIRLAKETSKVCAVLETQPLQL